MSSEIRNLVSFLSNCKLYGFVASVCMKLPLCLCIRSYRIYIKLLLAFMLSPRIHVSQAWYSGGYHAGYSGGYNAGYSASFFVCSSKDLFVFISWHFGCVNCIHFHPFSYSTCIVGPRIMGFLLLRYTCTYIYMHIKDGTCTVHAYMPILLGSS